jgi:hypothetical protein
VIGLNSLPAGPAPGPGSSPLPANAAAPAWPKPTPVPLKNSALTIHSKELELVHSPDTLGGFIVRVGGQPMAIGQNRPMIGYVAGGSLHWLDLAQAANRKVTVRSHRGALRAHFEGTDADGAHWNIEQQFTPGSAGAIEVRTEVTVDQDRAVAFLPMLTLFPGAGSFGETKGQALLAGLEYLENEPSSSEADIVGPGSHRQVPDNLKLTFPLMALQHNGRWLALSWRMRPHFSALFDSPDRLFGSGGHVLGLLFPGSDSKNRQEGSLLPKVCEMLNAGRPLVLDATLMGGAGASVTPAIARYIALRGLPPLPEDRMDLAHYASLTSAGWLDSKIHEGPLFRHAVAEGNFGPGRAADAAVWMEWLATRSPQQADRLVKAAQDAITGVPPEDLNFASVGHVRYPTPALIYGKVAENSAHAERTARAILARFAPDSSIRYVPRAGAMDFGKTHYTNEANGLTATSVRDLLEAAVVCGDRDLITAGLAKLRAMDKFSNGVPRGAQTWECPLHIPDILASAHLVRAYTLGYELTGETRFLEQARYWAWTGVPFVYLVNPTDRPIGLYGTIAVFGATHWKAPVWLGLPVQWCGLVYAEALYHLARRDPAGPWQRLADGITFSGIQQSWPESDAALKGLLPDSLTLRSQTRNGPAINPATLQVCALPYFRQPPAYDFACLRKSRLLIHAPGEIKNIEDKQGHVSFEVTNWIARPCYLLVNGFDKAPRVKLNGRPTDSSQFLQQEGRLILPMQGRAKVDLEW